MGSKKSEVISGLYKCSCASWLFIGHVFRKWQCYYVLRVEFLAFYCYKIVHLTLRPNWIVCGFNWSEKGNLIS